jgi:predicted cobalt transporter CbtA
MNKLLILMLVLWTTPLWAQSETEEAAVEDDSREEPVAAEPQPATDPFDYESSEQISEDLSVSFPVDI